jgi:hypothetical protein
MIQKRVNFYINQIKNLINGDFPWKFNNNPKTSHFLLLKYINVGEIPWEFTYNKLYKLK